MSSNRPASSARSFRPLAALRATWKRSPWIVISAGAHVAIGALLMLIVVDREAASHDDAPIATLVAPPRQLAQAFEPPVEEPIVRKPIDRTKDVELVTIELPADMPIDPTVERDWLEEPGLGESDDSSDRMPEISTNVGVGDKGGFRARAVNPYGRPRPGSTKGGPSGPPAGGDNVRCELAVLEGLRWLARHQSPDGRWSATALRELCLPGCGCAPAEPAANPYYDVGLSSLALLAYLGAGHAHDSRTFTADTVVPRKRVMGEIVRQGLDWLVGVQRDDGSISVGPAHMYNHALATMALCEAYGLSQHRHWREPAQRAVDFLVGAQKLNPNGNGAWGWRYAARQDIDAQKERGELDAEDYERELRDADTSVTTWCVMALKSAQLAGLKVPSASIDGALAYIRWVTPRESGAAPRGNQTGALDTSRYPGTVGYLDPSTAGQKVEGPGDHFVYHTASMSALGMCARAFGAHDLGDPFLEAAAKLLVKDVPTIAKDKLSIDYYYWYYGSLALNQFDGPDSPRQGQRYWKPWNAAMTRSLLELQDATAQNCSKGGWLVPDRWCHAGGPIYATALNVLTLEVYYRYENAFGAARDARARDGQGAEKRGEVRGTAGAVEVK